ncbi:hypothetical protein OAX78_03365 [Planctomycetota bacterium]|nr:hypothetical protein [Planctomycetota bacterium]
MSEFDNFVIFRLDWPLWEKIGTLCGTALRGDEALVSFLIDLGLQPEERDPRRAEGSDAAPETILAKLRLDPVGYSPQVFQRLADPPSRHDSFLVERALKQLARIDGPAFALMGQHSEEVGAFDLLSHFSPRLREWQWFPLVRQFEADAFRAELGAESVEKLFAALSEDPVDVSAVTVAMGYAPREPREADLPTGAVHSPSSVYRIAEELSKVQLEPVHGDTPLFEHLRAKREFELGDLEAELGSLARTYAEAAAAKQGVEATWWEQ